MKKSILTTLTFLTLGLTSISQTVANDAFKTISECKCREIIMIANKVEKAYSSVWLEGIQYENGSIIFSKGENKHYWNSEKIILVEKGNGVIRVYLD